MLLTGNGDMVQARCTPLGRQPTNGLKSKRKFKYVWRQMRTDLWLPMRRASREETDLELGISCKLLYIEWMNKVLL